MSRRNDPVDDFIRALSDKRVKELLGSIFDDQLKAALLEIEDLKRQNAQQSEQINDLVSELHVAQAKIDDLEAYNRRDNLIITGLPLANLAEAVTAAESSATMHVHEHAAVTERAVLALCQDKLEVPITPADISISHRLRKKRGSIDPPAVIVRFTNRKTRDAVYAARKKLKKYRENAIYINEDLTKNTAELFSQARKLVKQKRIASAWTSGGSVYYKLTDLPTCRAKRVVSSSDLPTSADI